MPSVYQSCACLDCVASSSISLHRSKVGSICAAEAVKSLQQPVLLREQPVSQPAHESGGEALFFLSNFNFNLFISPQMRNTVLSGLCPQPTSLPPPSPARTARTARSSRRRRTRISTKRTPLWSSKRRLDLRLELSSPCQSQHSPLPVS